MNTLKKEIEKKEPNRKVPRTPQKLKEYLRPGTKRKDRQINIARPTDPTKALVITAKIRGTRARILVNFGCLNNFVSPDFVKKAQFHTQAKKYQYTLYKINNQLMAENSGTIIKKTTPISVDIQGHWKRVNFDITRTNTYDAVLGLSWLEKHNPIINYKDRTIIFNSYDCKPTKNTNIKKVSVRAINAYFRQNPK
jgi:hypothetical protein